MFITGTTPQSSRSLTAVTTDQKGRVFHLTPDPGLDFSSSYNGYLACNLTLKRRYGMAWPDIGFGMRLAIYAGVKQVWYGFIALIEPGLAGNIETIRIGALGFWATTTWMTFTGTLTGTPEAKLALLMNTTYLPHLSTVTTGIIATGIVSTPTQSANRGTDDSRVQDMIHAICQEGTSTQQTVIPAVWGDIGASDGKPLLTTRALATTTPAARYKIERSHLIGLGLRRSLLAAQDRVIVRYTQTSDNTLQRVQVDDTSGENALGIYYTSGTLTPYINTTVLDVSGITTMTAAKATDVANTRLTRVKQIPNESQGFTVRNDFCIWDVNKGAYIRNCEVRAGYYIEVLGLIPRGNTNIGTGTAAGDKSLQTLFLISKTSYMAGVLQVTPDNSSQLQDLVV